jgi:hypothetical protein
MTVGPGGPAGPAGPGAPAGVIFVFNTLLYKCNHTTSSNHGFSILISNFICCITGTKVWWFLKVLVVASFSKAVIIRYIII